MKRTGIVLLVLLLVLLSAACGQKEETVTEPEAAAQEQQEVFYKQGKWQDRCYQSDFLSVSLTIPEGWGAMGTEQLLNAMGVERKDGQTYSEAVRELNVIYDGIFYKDNDSVLIQCQRVKNVDADAAVTKLCSQYVSGQEEECSVSETKDRDFCGKTYRFATVSGKETGKLAGFAVRAVDESYAAVLILNGETTLNECLNLFDK